MELNELTTALKSVEEKMEKTLSASTQNSEKLKALGEEQTKLARELVELQQKSAFRPVGETKQVSLGEQFTASKEYQALTSGSTRSIRVNLDASDMNPHKTPEGVVIPDRRAGIVHPAYYDKPVEKLLNAMTTTSNMVEFVKEATWFSHAVEVAEGTAKPKSGITFAVQQAPVQTVAHIAKVTKQLLADTPAIAAYINTRMIDGLAWRVEKEIVQGDGVTPNLKGLFAEGNYTPHGFTKKTCGSTLDLLSMSIATLQSLGYAPSAVLLNPLDWNVIALAKDTSGKYLIGDPASAIQNRVWGLPVVVSQAVERDKFLVGDFAAAGSVYTRQGITVEIFDQDEDNVSKNLVTIRVECRKALCIELPHALIGGSLTLAE